MHSSMASRRIGSWGFGGAAAASDTNRAIQGRGPLPIVGAASDFPSRRLSFAVRDVLDAKK